MALINPDQDPLDGIYERLARIHYTTYFEGLHDLESTWDEVPESHQLRMINAMKAVFEQGFKYKLGDLVSKISGSQWHGRVVGFYWTELTSQGYVVENATEWGSCQIYPEKALEKQT
jgi:ABC-type anion transport system duplicated permease subunit